MQQAGRIWWGAIAGLWLALWVPLVRGESPPVVAERQLYVPFAELEHVLGDAPEGLLLPLAEYRKLRSAELPAGESPDQLPLPREAQVTAEVVDGQLVLQATYTISQAAAGLRFWPLPLQNLALESARVDGAIPQLVREPGEKPRLLLAVRGAGEHKLELRLATPLVAVGSDRVAAFALPPVAAGQLEVRLPAGKFLQLGTGQVERGAPADQPATPQIALGNRKELTLRFSDARAEQAIPTLVFATSALGLHVAAGEQTFRSFTTLEVFGQPVATLTAELPGELQVTQVESEGLDRWEVATVEGRNRLVLTWRQPFTAARPVRITGVLGSQPGQPSDLPTLRWPSANAHRVGVLLQVADGLRLQILASQGVRRIAADDQTAGLLNRTLDMAVSVAETQRQRFSAWRDDFQLSYVAIPRAREVWTSVTTRLSIGQPELRLESSLRLQPRLGPIFDFDLLVPADWNILELTTDDQPARWRMLGSEPGWNLVRVQFPQPIAPQGKVELRLVAVNTPSQNWPPETEPLLLALPEIQLPLATATLGRYVVRADGDLELATRELQGLDPLPLVAEEIADQGGTTLAWEHLESRYGGQLQITRRPSRLVARTLALHALGRREVATRLELQLVFQGGGARLVKLLLPEAVGTDLQFRLAGAELTSGRNALNLTEQSSEPSAGGQREWTLRFDDRALGLVRLAVELRQPRVDSGTPIDLPGVRVLGAERQFGQVGVEAEAEQSLDIEARHADGQPLREIDAADLAQPVAFAPAGRVAGAFEAARVGERVRVTETRFATGPIPTAICDQLELTTVVGGTGELQHRAEFVVRGVGIQGLLVQPPGEAELWATLVDGRPLEVRREPGTKTEAAIYHIALPEVDPPVRARRVTLLYLTRRGVGGGLPPLYEHPPVVQVLTGRGERLPVDVLDHSWRLHHPQRWSVIRSEGEFVPAQTLTRPSLLLSWRESLLGMSLDVPSMPRLFWLCVLVLVIWLVQRVRVGAFRAWRMSTPVWVALAVVLLLVPVVGWMLSLGGMSRAPQSPSDFTRSSWSNPHPMAQAGAAPSGPPTQMMSEAVSAPAPTPAPAPAPDPDLTPTPAAEDPLEEFESQAAGDKAKKADAAPATPRFRQDQEVDFEPPHDGVKMDPAAASGKPPARAPARGLPQVPGPAQPGGGDRPGLGGQAPPVGEPAGAAPFAKPNAPPNNGVANNEAPPQAGRAGAVPADRAAKRRGRLSLPVEMTVPQGSVEHLWRYRGGRDAGGLPALQVEFSDERQAGLFRLAWALGTLLLFWLVRRQSLLVRGLVGLLALAVPWALAPLMRLDLLPALDGLFLGAVGGWLLWLLCWLLPRLAAWLPVTVQPAHPLLLPLLACLLWAQANTVAAQTANAQAQAGASEGGPATEARTSPPRISPWQTPQTVVIPYDPLQGVKAAESVFVPWGRYQLLRRSEEWAQTPPQVLSRFEVTPLPARPGQPGLARVRATFELFATSRDPAPLELPLGALPTTVATLDQATAPLVVGADPNEPLKVVLKEPGPHTLVLELELPCEATANSGRLTLPLRGPTTGRVELQLPANDSTLRVEGAATGFRRVVADGRARAEIPLREPGPLTVTWGPPGVRVADQNVVHAETTSALQLDDAGVTLRAHHLFRVRQGVVSDLAWRLPAEWLVRELSGPDLASWELDLAESPAMLRVHLRRPVTDTTGLTVDLFRRELLGEEPVPLEFPALEPVGVARETGLVALLAEDQFALTAAPGRGVSQVDVSQFPEPASDVGRTIHPPGSPRPQRVFRFVGRPAELTFTAARQKPASRGTSVQGVAVTPRRVLHSARFDLNLAGAPQAEVTFQLPEQFLLYEVRCSGGADSWIGSDAGGAAGVLHVEFATPRAGEVTVEIDGVIPRFADDPVAIIAPIVPLDVSDLRSTLGLWIDPVFEAKVDAEAEAGSGWKTTDPAQLPATLPRPQPRNPRFAWTGNQAELAPLALTLDPAVVRVSADSLTQVLIRDSAIDLVLYLRWQIEAAATRRLAIVLPEELADRVELAPANPQHRLRQISRDPPQGGRRRLLIEFEEPLAGEVVLTGLASFALPESGLIPAPLVQFEQPLETGGVLQYRAPETTRGFLLLVNQSRQTARGEGLAALESIPVTDLPLKIPPEIARQATGLYRVLDPKAEVGWQLESATAVRFAGAAVNYVVLRQVLSPDGTWRMRAEYRVVNRARQFLPVELPPDSRLLSVLVNGRPDRPIEPGANAPAGRVLIPIPRTAAGELPETVELVLEGRLPQKLPRGVQLWGTPFDLPAPRVLTPEADPERGIPVASTEWTIELPEGLQARLIEDPNRSNVSAAPTGLQPLIAGYEEWLELYRQLEDPNLSAVARLRCAGNLQSASATLRSVETILKLPDQFEDPTQRAQLTRLKGLRQQVEQLRPRASALNLGNPAPTLFNGYVALEGLLLANSAAPSTGSGGKGEMVQQGRLNFQRAETKAAEPQSSVGNNRLLLDKELQSQLGQQVRRQQVPSKPGSGKGSGGRQSGTDGQQEQAAQQLQLEREASRGERRKDQSGPQQRAAELEQRQIDQLEAGFAGQALNFAGDAAGEGRPGADDFRRRDQGENRFDFGAGFGVGGFGDVGGGRPADPRGLSLQVNLPGEPSQFTYGKSGGDARLAVSLLPKSSYQAGWGVAWALAWLLLVGLLVWLGQGSAHKLKRWLAPVLFVLGAGVWLLSPAENPWSWLGFLLAAAGCWVWMQHMLTPAHQPGE